MEKNGLGRRRSRLWRHFSPTGVHGAKCDLCQKVLSCKGGTTSNLKRHLRAKHPLALAEMAEIDFVDVEKTAGRHAVNESDEDESVFPVSETTTSVAAKAEAAPFFEPRIHEKMAQSYFSLAWDSFENNMCSKFTALQQTGDFVDLTLAADGHLVRVHQLILGIASPYIKELIHSAPCKHPVIFLNNISFSTLCSILQYVYTGEVAIPEDQLQAFFQAAKALQIQGIGSGDLKFDAKESDRGETAPRESNPGLQTIQIEVVDNRNSHFEKVAVPITAKNIKISGTPQRNLNIQQSPSQSVTESPSRFSDLDTSKEMDMSECSELEILDEDFVENSRVTAKCSRNGSDEDFELTGLVDAAPSALPGNNELQYTVSIRGSLQLILNRYIYNLFSKSGGGKVRRWRCVDYKVQKCPACTVTNGDMVVKRINMHNHPYHDTKILGKIRKKAVYSAIKSIKNDSTINT